MSSSWSRTRQSTRRRGAGGSPTSRTADLATRRCIRPASHATSQPRIATTSSPDTPGERRTQRVVLSRRFSLMERPMKQSTYDKDITALLVIDPYNDFISEGGKIWPRVRAVAEANSCVPNMLRVLDAARRAKLRVFYAMHHRYRPGDYETWKYVAPIQR